MSSNSPLPPLVEPAAELTRDEVARYSRHLIIPDVGVTGQKRLKNAKVLVIGAGGLGSPALLYLAAAGVGTLGIVEFDEVDTSNLQRQVIHGESDVGRPKAESARDSIREINSNVEVRLHELRLEPENAVDLFREYDLILDGTDNFATRYLVNDAAVLAGKPYVWGSIYRFEGQVSMFWEDAPDGRGHQLPRPVPGGAAAGHGAVVCRGRRSRRAVRVDRLDHGDRGDQADHRHRRHTARPADGLRRTRHELPHHQAAPRSGAPADHRTDRLRGVLRRGVRGGPGGRGRLDDHRGRAARLLEAGKDIELIDVREPVEWDIVRIEGAKLIPKDRILSGEALAELPQNKPIVLHCKTGVRSAEALAALKKAGFSDATHLQGGVMAWASQVDPSLPVY